MRILFRILLPLVLLALGWFGYQKLSVEKDKPKRPMPPQQIITTKVVPLKKIDYQTIITTQGVVRPHSEASFTAQVSGKVKSISEKLQDGAFFEKDDVLLEIDSEDLAAGIVSAEAELARASAAYSQEEARANQAKLNWEDLGYTEKPNDLVLRLPQMREARANVDAAEASLQRAKRDLERAQVRAPFDGRVLLRSVAIGQSITPSTALAVIFNTDFVEVRLPIASAELAYLNLPESPSDPPVEVTLTDALNSQITVEWKGTIIGTEGALDPGSRELFAIARVEDPFNRLPQSGDDEARPALRIGQPVTAAVPGKKLEGVYVIPRSSVRQLDRIALVVEKELDEGETPPTPEEDPKLVLKVLEIDPIFSTLEEFVIRTSEIADNAVLATTRLIYAPPNTPVKIIPDMTEDEEDTSTAAGKGAKPDKT